MTVIYDDNYNHCNHCNTMIYDDTDNNNDFYPEMGKCGHMLELATLLSCSEHLMPEILY